MKYEDGFEVLLHDQVDLGGGVTGTVVAVLDTGMYTPDYLEEHWGYLAQGALVKSSEMGLVHFPYPDVDFTLIRRG
ncbi:hypothetical protein L0938_13530 [Paracidovorax citrulli]